MLLGVKDAEYILDSPFKSDRLSKQTCRNNMSNQVLRLNADYSPMPSMLSWEDAVELILMDKAILVEAVPGKFVRSEHLVLPWPSIVALKRYRQVRARVRFSSRNVITRDRGICCFCGYAPKDRQGFIDRTELTMDHCIPRQQGRLEHNSVWLPWSRETVALTSWKNCVAACRSCNSQKANRTPEQAGMQMRYLPRTPSNMDVLRIALARVRNIPNEWLQYLPADFNTTGRDSTTAPMEAQVIKYTGS